MDKKPREDYEIEDFLTDESFTNYLFHSNIEDQLSWEKWLINHPEKRAIVKQARELMQTLSLTISDKEFSGELEKIKTAINTKVSQPVFSLLNWSNKSGKSAIPTGSKRKIFYLIPMLLIFIVFGYLLLPVLQGSSGQFTETVNKNNTPLSLTLSDSTVVTLEAHSTLQYPLNFKDDKRNVYLQGEAQFNVKRNLNAPFKVYNENVVATVLGTVFNFKKPGDSAMVVELLQGKLTVEIMNDKKLPVESILLDPDEKAIYVFHDQHFYKKTMIPEINIHFHQNNFAEIASQIKNVFGIIVINESNKKSWRFTGEFKNTTAKEIIENICVVKKLSAEVKGDTIYIK